MNNTLPKAAVDALEFEEKILPNGLCVRLISMPEYSAVHAIYATKFGSINRKFTQNGKTMDLPSGIAHFLEHKMFENKDGVDAFTLYSETGAAANAYTGFDRTSYVFTSSREIDKNLDILLSFVGHPYFTEKTVQKEQSIIGQEIGMYQDHAEWCNMMGILQCLYHNHPVRDDIAGTVESIAEITPEMLYSCTDAYYHPSNMILCAAGNVSMEQLLSAVERAGLPKEASPRVETVFPHEPGDIHMSRKELSMAVAMPMFALGFKEKPVQESTLKTEVVCDLLGEMLCGESSALYRSLYDEGLVQPDFGMEFGCHAGCLHFMITGESNQPDVVRERILSEINRQRTQGISKEQFDICKKMMYGEAIADLESVERMASLLSQSYFKGRTPAQELDAIASVSIEDVQAALSEMLQEEKSAFMLINPMK